MCVWPILCEPQLTGYVSVTLVVCGFYLSKVEEKCWDRDISHNRFVSFICYLPTATRWPGHNPIWDGKLSDFVISSSTHREGMELDPTLLQSPKAKRSNTERRIKGLLCPEKLGKKEVWSFASKHPHPQQACLLLLWSRVESLITGEDKKPDLLEECRERLMLYQLR